MTEQARCELCGEPMPPGEEMFKFHGYSGPCPKPPLPKPQVLAAFTATGDYTYYPPYINLRRSEDGRSIIVTLRGDEKSTGAGGDDCIATFSINEFAAFLREAVSNL